MTDIVERLRSPVRFATETQAQAKHRHFFERGEAADEITRLRKIVIEYEEQGQDIASDICKEIVRLREANKEFVTVLEWYADTFCEHFRSSECCGRLDDDECSGCRARKTLSKHKGEQK